MKKQFYFYFLLFTSFASFSQSSSPVGIYYLEGIMETASGFKLDADSTFEFFFSQGALDRTGKGTWHREGNTIIFQSTGKHEKGFVLVKSVKTKSKKASIKVVESNTMLLSFIYARVNGDGEFVKLPDEGVLETDISPASKIQLIFELCPETIHEYVPQNTGDNYFEFAFHPAIFNVYFNRFELKQEEGKLKGGHPLLSGGQFIYAKED